METFNSVFYLAAATIIPFLYVALLLPSSWFIRTYISLEKGEHHLIKQEWPKQKVVGNLFDKIFMTIIKCIFYLVFLAGSVGEIAAINALDKNYATPLEHKYVLVSLYVLVIWVTLNSIATIARKSNNK